MQLSLDNVVVGGYGVWAFRLSIQTKKM